MFRVIQNPELASLISDLDLQLVPGRYPFWYLRLVLKPFLSRRTRFFCDEYRDFVRSQGALRSWRSRAMYETYRKGSRKSLSSSLACQGKLF